MNTAWRFMTCTRRRRTRADYPQTACIGLNALDALPDAVLACLRAAEKVAQLTGVADTSYRVLTNVGEHGCQSVHHLHFHVLGGRQLPDRMA